MDDFISAVLGHGGRLLQRGRVLSTLGDFDAKPLPDRSGWRVCVSTHTPHPLWWKHRDAAADVTAELLVGRSTQRVPAVIVSAEPLVLHTRIPAED